jgi:NAD+--asparagine ADP-ribosyltransferase
MGAQKNHVAGEKVGTNTYWTKERIKEASKAIFDGMVEGKSVRSILDPKTRDKKKFPSYVTFLEWLNADNEMSKQYARAMEWRAEGLLEDTIDIADDGSNDYVSGDVKKPDIEHIQRTRLRVEARQFALRKMAPKKYGDKLDVTSGDQPIQCAPIIISLDGNSLRANLKISPPVDADAELLSLKEGDE